IKVAHGVVAHNVTRIQCGRAVAKQRDAVVAAIYRIAFYQQAIGRVTAGSGTVGGPADGDARCGGVVPHVAAGHVEVVVVAGRSGYGVVQAVFGAAARPRDADDIVGNIDVSARVIDAVSGGRRRGSLVVRRNRVVVNPGEGRPQ
nr:hypothetical protein [Tanacetum cinerariifolium]